MTALEKTYSLFSVAAGGREEKLGEVPAVVSRQSDRTIERDDTVSLSESFIACVREQNAPEGGFVRGMKLLRGRRGFTVESAVLSSRLWMLRLSRTLTDGEA